MSAGEATGPQGPVQADYDEIEKLLGWIYGPDRIEQVWLTGFENIQNETNWKGQQGFSQLKARVPDPTVADMYFCIGRLREGADRRGNGNVDAQPLLIVDDIGTKVPWEKWSDLFRVGGFPRPSFVVETSPGNNTMAWVLDGDATGAQRWQDLALIRAWLVEKGLTDNVMDEARYVRLPTGWNSKSKYRQAVSDPNPVVGWASGWPVRWGERVSLNDIGVALLGRKDWQDAPMPVGGMTGAQLTAVVGAGALRRTADMNNPEPLIQLAMELGKNPVQIRAGVVEALCPNIAEHGDRPETGFAFLGNGLCQCNHAHCQGLRSSDFRQMLETEYDNRMETARALGTDTGDAPATAGEFMARRAFEFHGVDFGSPAEREKVEAVAEAMAVRSAEQDALREMKLDEALGRLCDRFVWVNAQKSFFDLEARKFVDKDGFDTHPEVLLHFEAGATGKARAVNRVLNDTRGLKADGTAFVPGNPDALITIPGENGAMHDAVNTWVGVDVGRRAGAPKDWFELVEHVLPEPTYREWFYNWLAHLVQRPGKVMPTVPIVVGGQGTGKDMMMVPIQAILGRHNVRKADAAMLESPFNSWQVCVLVIMSEVKMDAAGLIYNRLKDWTGNSSGWLTINEKYQKPYQIPPVANFMGFTNHSDALMGIEPDDRRIAAFISPAVPREPVWYAAKAAALSSAEEVERVHEFLMARDISAFNPFEAAPDPTGAKRFLLRATLSRSAFWASEQCTEFGGRFVDRKFLTIGEVLDTLRRLNDVDLLRGAGVNSIRKGFEAAGLIFARRARASGDTASIWFGLAMCGEDAVSAAAREKFLSLDQKDQLAAYEADRDAAAARVDQEVEKLLGGTGNGSRLRSVK